MGRSKSGDARDAELAVRGLQRIIFSDCDASRFHRVSLLTAHELGQLDDNSLYGFTIL